MGGRSPRSATKTVQTYVSALRRVLPVGAIETVAGSYRLAVGPDDVDAACFEAWPPEEQPRWEAAMPPLPPLVTWTEALGLWRGRALVDLAGQPAGTAEAARLEDSGGAPRRTWPKRAWPRGATTAWSRSWRPWWPKSPCGSAAGGY